MANQQTAVPVDRETLQQMDRVFRNITPGEWTIRYYEGGGDGDEEVIKWIEINDGSAAYGNNEPEIITYGIRSRTSIADYRFLALAQRSYPTLSMVLHAMLKNERHPSFIDAEIMASELDKVFLKTSKGSWEVEDCDLAFVDPTVVTPRGRIVFEMCAGEVGDKNHSTKDARFAGDFQAIFPGIRMAFQEYALKQVNRGSILSESGTLH